MTQSTSRRRNSTRSLTAALFILAATFQLNAAEKQLLVVANPVNKNLEAFCIKENRLYHSWWQNGQWQGWGTDHLPNVATARDITAVANPTTKNLEVFIIDAQNQLQYRVFNGSWHTGGIAQAPAAKSAVLCTHPVSKHMEAFLIGTDGWLYHNWFENGTWHQWGTNHLGAPTTASDVCTIANPRTNDLEVFVLDHAGQLKHLTCGKVWQSGSIKAPPVRGTRVFMVTNDTTKVIEAFLVAQNGLLYHSYFDRSWHDWKVDMQGVPNAIHVAGATNVRSKNMELFITDNNGQLQYRVFNDRWNHGSIPQLPTNAIRQCSLIVNPVTLFVEGIALGADGRIYQTHCNQAFQWQPWWAAL